MALITRVTRLFRADLHEVLDRLEEPDVLLRQAVREMEEELAHDEHRMRQLDQELAGLGARRAALEQSLSGIARELDVCFAADNAVLARAALRRRLEGERVLEVLARRGEGLAGERDALAARLAENRRHLDAMRQKVELFAAEDTAYRDNTGAGGAEVMVRDEDVEIAFLAEQQRRAGP